LTCTTAPSVKGVTSLPRSWCMSSIDFCVGLE
jgi:hypothetical protein